MMDVFSRLFGPYPFADYTVVVTDDELEIPLEAQGLSIFGANHCTGRRWSERLVAHELAHQWFGNSLTLGQWRDIWLHEASPVTRSGSGRRTPVDIPRTSSPCRLIRAWPANRRTW